MEVHCNRLRGLRYYQQVQCKIGLMDLVVIFRVYFSIKCPNSQYNQYLFRKMEVDHNNRAKIFNKFIISVSPLFTTDTWSLFHTKYYIKEFKIEQIDEAMAKQIYAGILARSKKSFVNRSQLNWLQNELRMFVWTLVYYAHLQHIEIQDFTQEQWEFFLTLFPNKRKILFQYQAYNLLKNHNQYKKWSREQDHLFEQLVKKDEFRLRWSDLGKALFIESDRKYFRTPKQCRERWLNHLDPSKMKKCWEEQQDFLLIQYVKYFGKKWANISKKLSNRRNEHSIKNRFKSLMTKESKLFGGEVTEKELVDSLYRRMLESKAKSCLEKQESLQIQQNQHQSHNWPLENEHSAFEQERPDQSIFDYCEYSSMLKKQAHCTTQILCNLSLNRNYSLVSRLSKNQSIPQKPIFEMSKVSQCESKNDENSKKSSWQENEAEKRIRADLFLQEDPFQMIKGYLYKHSSSE